MVKSEWINVEDRLPPNIENVWGWNKEHKHGLECYYHDGDWHPLNSDQYIGTITHWQPLPPTPTN